MKFEITEYQVDSEKITKGCEFTFVFLSDLHIKDFGQNNQELIEAIRQIKPDAVLSGGDMVLAKGIHSLDVPVKLLTMLAKDFSVYVAKGNHEIRMERDRDVYGDQADVYRAALQKAGCVLLDNTQAVMEKNGNKIHVWGLDIPKTYYRKLKKAQMPVSFVEESLGEPEENEFHLLMAHSPNYIEVYGEWGADVALAGHFHGGTIRLPILGAVMSPDFEFFPRYAHGRFEWSHEDKHCSMMVSSGLGTHSVNLRINDPPELLVIRIRGTRG